MNTSQILQIHCRSLGLLRNLLGHWMKSFMENFERSKATRQKFEGFKSLSLVLFKSRTSSIISKIKFALFQQKFYMKYTNILFQCTSPITSTFSGWHRRTWTSPWVFLMRTLFQRSLHITLNFNAWLGGRRKIVIPSLLPHTRIFNFWQKSERLKYVRNYVSLSQMGVSKPITIFGQKKRKKWYIQGVPEKSWF